MCGGNIWKEVSKSYQYGRLIPKLKVLVRHRPLQFSTPQGPIGRLKKMRRTVTALFKYERVETTVPRATEARGYAERLISDAMRYGDCHKPTMEMADFWLEEKQIIHKLFKVLVPRYINYDTCYTNLELLPRVIEESVRGSPMTGSARAVLELKGNPLPPIIPERISNEFQIHNILLREAQLELKNEQLSSVTDDLNEEQPVIKNETN